MVYSRKQRITRMDLLLSRSGGFHLFEDFVRRRTYIFAFGSPIAANHSFLYDFSVPDQV